MGLILILSIMNIGVLLASSTGGLEKSAPRCTFCTRGEIKEPAKPFSSMIPGYDFVDTCGTMDQLLPTMLIEEDPKCARIQSLSTYCGCPPPEDSCSLCPDDVSRVSLPEQEVPWLRTAFEGVVPTCALIEIHAESLSVDDEKCSLFQSISSYCGCPALPNHCEYCDGESLKKDFYDVELPFLNDEENGFVGTCEAYYWTQFQVADADPKCEVSDFVTIHCGCHESVLQYYGTSTLTQQNILSWVSRGVGALSLIASLSILYDVAWVTKNTAATVYHNIILSIVVFDMITSVVFIVGPIVVPSTNEVTGLSSGIYGALGTNMTSCKVFGFLFHLGLTSVLLNVSLTVYFLLVISLRMQEATMRRYRVYLLAPPLVVGFALSFAAIPFIGGSFMTCQVVAFPLSLHSWRLLVFFLIPVASATITIFILLGIMHFQVHSKCRRYPSNVVSSPATTRLESQAFWQCVTYAAAFGVTWPISVLVQYQGPRMAGSYGFWILAVCLSPLQGANNALCYFRPRLVMLLRRNVVLDDSKDSSSPAASDENANPVVELVNQIGHNGFTGNNDSLSSEDDEIEDPNDVLSSLSSDGFELVAYAGR